MSILPSALRARLVEGFGASLERATPVGGGSISEAARIEVGGRSFFVKWHLTAPPGFFAAEASGLARLAATGAIRVPEPLEWDDAEGERPAFIVMEHIEGPGWAALDRAAFGRRLGEQLARLHRTPQPSFGLEDDNFIGELPQPNAPTSSWRELYFDRRIGFQLELARSRGALRGAHIEAVERFCARARQEVEDHPHAALLHGDLWSGNLLIDAQGQPVLVDPAVYHGDREVELAFTELFGGFPASFYESYASCFPLEPGYRERCGIYQAYPLLVHVNLFGGRYVKDLMAAIAPWSGR